MKKPLRHWAAAAVGAVAAIAFTSCAYDPSYSSVGGSYSSGYGDGYGYGGSNFSTSLFVSTGDPRWGYDPYSYSYYDYNRRCYYDPYLHGYYPRGYRPVAIDGCPHPGGWRSGSRYCPPPSYVRNVTVVNYRNRESSYRNSNYSWSKQVRERRDSGSRYQGRPDQGKYDKPSSGYNRPDKSTRPYYGSSGTQYQTKKPYIQDSKPGYRDPKKSRVPSGYNTPVYQKPSQKAKPSQKYQGYDKRSQSYDRRPQNATKPTYQKSRQENSGRREEQKYKEEGKRLRSLGQG